MKTRILRLKAVSVYIVMGMDETADQAEDRFLEAMKDAGVDVAGWVRGEVEETEE